MAKYSRVLRRGGGVALFVKNCLTDCVTEITLIADYCIELDIEVIMAKINYLGLVDFYIATYRSPDGNFNIFLSNVDVILSRLVSKYGNVNILILGDLNLDTLSKTQIADFLWIYWLLIA